MKIAIMTFAARRNQYIRKREVNEKSSIQYYLSPVHRVSSKLKAVAGWRDFARDLIFSSCPGIRKTG